MGIYIASSLSHKDMLDGMTCMRVDSAGLMCTRNGVSLRGKGK